MADSLAKRLEEAFQRPKEYSKEYRLPEVVDRPRINPITGTGRHGEGPCRGCGKIYEEADPRLFCYCPACVAANGNPKGYDRLPYIILSPATKFALSWAEQIEDREATRFRKKESKDAPQGR